MKAMLAFAGTGLVLLAACGDGGAKEEQTKVGLEKRAQSYLEAFRDDPPKTSYAYFRKSCRDEHSLGEYSQGIVIAKAFFEGFLKIDYDDIRFEDIEASVEDHDGVVTMTMIDKDGDELFGDDEGDPTAWIFEDGNWFLIDCSEMAFEDD